MKKEKLLIKDCFTSIRIIRSLEKINIVTLDELSKMTTTQLFKTNTIGRRSFYEIQKVLVCNGYHLKKVKDLEAKNIFGWMENAERNISIILSVLDGDSIKELATKHNRTKSLIRQTIIKVCRKLDPVFFYTKLQEEGTLTDILRRHKKHIKSLINELNN